MIIGTSVRVINKENLFYNCEGYILEVYDTYDIDGEDGYVVGYMVNLTKPNDRVTQEELDEYYVFFNKTELEKI